MDIEKLEKFKEDINDKLSPFYAPRDENFKIISYIGFMILSFPNKFKCFSVN